MEDLLHPTLNQPTTSRYKPLQTVTSRYSLAPNFKLKYWALGHPAEIVIPVLCPIAMWCVSLACIQLAFLAEFVSALHAWLLVKPSSLIPQ